MYCIFVVTYPNINDMKSIICCREWETKIKQKNNCIRYGQSQNDVCNSVPRYPRPSPFPNDTVTFLEHYHSQNSPYALKLSEEHKYPTQHASIIPMAPPLGGVFHMLSSKISRNRSQAECNTNWYLIRHGHSCRCFADVVVVIIASLSSLASLKNRISSGSLNSSSSNFKRWWWESLLLA